MQKHVNLVDLVKSFRTSIYLQILASTQPRTSLVKLARSPCTDRPGKTGSKTFSFQRRVLIHIRFDCGGSRRACSRLALSRLREKLLEARWNDEEALAGEFDAKVLEL